jgi:hypothetical protein
MKPTFSFLIPPFFYLSMGVSLALGQLEKKSGGCLLHLY